MEIFELHYFYAVAENESIQKAAKKLFISNSSLSKAITRLEEEFKINLFEKDGRGIRLTTKGHELYLQCQKIFELENETKALMAGLNAQVEISLTGSELLLSTYGVEYCQKIRKLHPEAKFNFHEHNNKTTEAMILAQNHDIGFVIDPLIKHKDLHYKLLDSIQFFTYVGKSHPLFTSKKAIHIGDLLEYDFLTPEPSLFNLSSSVDGWRDDQFPRKIRYEGVGQKTLEALITQGHAIGYLPENLGMSLNFKKLNLTGCPYKCQQEIYIISKKTSSRQWLRSLF